MTSISPTRVSMYDFLYQDTQPMVSLLADAAHLSLPQTQLALGSSLQAIISALLSYHQRHQGQAISKKLFNRSAVKELRQFNSMNFATMNATLYHNRDTADAIFGDSARVMKASEYIATKIDATSSQAQILLTTLCVIALRELAILAEYSQLDNDEIDKWFSLQPQFLSVARFANTETSKLSASEATEPEATESELPLLTPPPFDAYWYELTDLKLENHEPTQDMQLATGNYLKAIGRSSQNTQVGVHNDLLIFAQMNAIALPHQRWLLQLAKISDIYLKRNRLRITSEPATPPTRPLVSLGLISGNNDNTPTTASEKPIEYDESAPLWKNPIIIILIIVIASLSALAALKYQKQKSHGVIPATEAVLEHDLAKQHQQQDVAIVMIDENDANEEPTTKQPAAKK